MRAAASSAPRRSWREWAGRDYGKDSYRIGDIVLGLRRSRALRREHRAGTDRGCPHGAEGLASDGLAAAQEGLALLQKGLASFDCANMPHGRHALEEVRRSVVVLEARVAEAICWQRLAPSAGCLLQANVCSAAGSEEPPEWSMGQLFVSREALLFQSGDRPPWTIGPVRREDIVRAERVDDGLAVDTSSTARVRDICLELRDGCAYLLSGREVAGVLESFEGLTIASPRATVATSSGVAADKTGDSVTESADATPPGGCVKDDDEALKRWLTQWAPGTGDTSSGDNERHSVGHTSIDPAASAATALPVPARFFSSVDSEPAAARISVDSAADQARISAESAASDAGYSSALAGVSFLRAAEELPAAELPQRTDPPTFSTVLPRATLRDVKRALCVNKAWPIEAIYAKEYQAVDFVSTPWVKAQRLPGTKVRRLRFRMPVPDKVPGAIQRLVRVPSETQVTLLSRIGGSEDALVMVQESATPDTPFGEHYWIQEVHVFKPSVGGGVTYEKFLDLRWVKPLPWYAKFVGSFIDAEAKASSASIGKFLMQRLNAAT